MQHDVAFNFLAGGKYLCLLISYLLLYFIFSYSPDEAWRDYILKIFGARHAMEMLHWNIC